jgi:hypothetical protein
MDEIRPIKPPPSPSERAEAVKPTGERRRRQGQEKGRRRGRRAPGDRNPTNDPEKDEPGQIIDLEA